jgi:type IV pilus assembly protein PilX
LVIALIFLVILSLLGASVASNNVLQERMAGNSRNHDLAFQAAEAALRAADNLRDTWKNGPWDVSNDGLLAAYGDGHRNDTPYWRDAFTCSSTDIVSVAVSGTGVSACYVIERVTSGVNTFRVTARGQAPGNAVAVLQATYVY